MEKSKNINSLKFIGEVLFRARIGFFSIVFDLQSGSATMKLNEYAKKMLGVLDDKEPEDVYVYWLSGLDESSRQNFILNLKNNKNDVISFENNYLWKHPQKGFLNLRCFIDKSKNHKDSLFINGYIQDVGNVNINDEKKHGIVTKNSVLKKEDFLLKLDHILNTNTDRRQHYWFILSQLDNFEIYLENELDDALLQISDVFKNQLRQNDNIGYFDNVKFAVMVKVATQDEAMIVAEKLRTAIEESKFALQGKLVQLTSSFGVVKLPDQRNDCAFDRIFESADKAIRQAQEQGFNRSVLYFEQN